MALLFNARGETVTEKPAFRNAMRRRRCLIPADGFYEWKSMGSRKQPYYMQAQDGMPFAFAGLWDVWTGPNGEEMETAAIITTTANASLSALHARMPVVIPPEGYATWLDCMNVDEKAAQMWIRPAAEDFFSIRPVSMAVNRAANDEASLIVPVTEADVVTEDEIVRKAPPTTSRASRMKKVKPPSDEDDGQASLF